MRGVDRVRQHHACAPGGEYARAFSGGAARARATGGAALAAAAGAVSALQRLLIVGSRELDRTITDILAEAVRHVGAERGGVLLFGGRGSAQLDRSWGISGASAPSFSNLRAPWTTAEVMARRPVIFTTPRELPSKAAVDVDELRANGVRSGMLVPLGSEVGPVIGWAGFITLRKERAWSREDVAAALEYGSLLAAGLLRLRVERERERELQFQRLASMVAASFLGRPLASLADSLQPALRQCAAFVGADRANAWSVGEDGRTARLLASWTSGSLPDLPKGATLGGEMSVIGPVLRRHLAENRPWILESLDDLPSRANRERKELRVRGVGSLLAVPLRQADEGIGWLVLVRGAPGTWRSRTVDRMKIIGSLVGGALARARTADRLARSELDARTSRDLLQSTVDALSDHIAIVNREGIIVAVNRAWRRYADENRLRMPRYAVGASYLAICEAARAVCEDAGAVADAIRTLARGGTEEYHREYPCPGPRQMRWFRLRMTRFGEGEATRFVMAHQDVTELKAAEEQLRQLTRELLAAQDAERRRIARELHDGAAQNVFATSLELARLRARAADADAARALQECETLCRDALKQLRTMTYVLHPLHLDESGLGPAVRWYVPGFSRRSGIAARCRVGRIGRLDPAVELALFRVLQEALANVQHHSRARYVHVALSARHRQIVLSVRDDGRGGAPRPGEPGVGIGIAGMRERLEQFGGDLEIVSGRRGTDVRARVPVASRAPGARELRPGQRVKDALRPRALPAHAPRRR